MKDYIPLFISIIAIILTFIQILLSNKQSLFDRRLDLYMKSRGLYELWKEHREQLLCYDKNEKIAANDLLFTFLTNNSFLYEVKPVIDTLLENLENRQKFLLKIEELKTLNEEIKFVFKGSEKEVVSSFINNYHKLLFVMFQYQIAFNHEREKINKSLNKEQEKILEPSIELKKRQELICKIKETDKSFLEIENRKVFENLAKQIKLIVFTY